MSGEQVADSLSLGCNGSPKVGTQRKDHLKPRKEKSRSEKSNGIWLLLKEQRKTLECYRIL